MPYEGAIAHTHYCGNLTRGTIVLVPGAVFVMAMGMLHLECDHIQRTMAHATLGDQAFGKAANSRRFATQHHRLETVFVVEMGVHGGHCQIVMVML